MPVLFISIVAIRYKMEEIMGFYSDYISWLKSSEKERDLADYASAMWQALQEPERLSQDAELLYKSYAFMQVCKGSKKRQYLVVYDIAFRDHFNQDDLELCLFGKLIQKLLEARAALTKKQKALPETEFYKYLFGTTVIILGNCLTELAHEIRGAKQEMQESEHGYEPHKGQILPPIEILQYQIQVRQQAQYLKNHIQEHWKPQELNVLCHDLESSGTIACERLRDETQTNIYKLHQRIREKLRKTLYDQGLCEEAGRLFVGRYLEKMCQNCEVLSTYKGIKKARNKGDSNAGKQ